MKKTIETSFFKMLKNIYNWQQSMIEMFRGYARHRCEIRKFKDQRRVKIYSKVKLSSAQKQEIDDLFVNNYGKKIPYTWHRHFTAFTGNFDKNYFPELLYIPEFEYFMNYNQNYAHVLEDKNLLPYLTKFAQIRSPKTLLSCVEGVYRNADAQIIDTLQFEQQFNNLGDAFAKPSVDSCSGNGCFVLNMQKGKDILSGKSSAQLLDELGLNFVIQERLICHKSIAEIYSHSVNTFRIITYRWKDEIYHTPLILRIGANGKNVDNAHAGGMFIAVDDNGTLHEKAFTEFNKQYTSHPDTHFVFKGHIIPHVEQLIQAAKRMHALIPQLGCCNWDFTLNQQGNPVLIEINLRGGGCWPAQMSHGKGLFGERTAEILRWLRFMNSIPYCERKFYKPGYITKK